MDSKPMMLSSAYCFGVMICHILAELWAVELIPGLKHSITLYIIYLKKHIEYSRNTTHILRTRLI